VQLRRDGAFEFDDRRCVAELLGARK